jgi:hypothetical protein
MTSNASEATPSTTTLKSQQSSRDIEVLESHVAEHRMTFERVKTPSFNPRNRIRDIKGWDATRPWRSFIPYPIARYVADQVKLASSHFIQTSTMNEPKEPRA